MRAPYPPRTPFRSFARGWVLGALALLGCLPAPEPFRCDRAGGDLACDSVPGGRCVMGYCAEAASKSLCPSGLRYTASAASPRACAPALDASSPQDALDAPDATLDVAQVDDRGDVTGDLGSLTDLPDASGLVDLPDRVDAVDAPAVTDAVDVPAVTDAVDVPAVTDAADASAPPSSLSWLSPLPNERYLSATVIVRVRRGGERVFVRTALGNACAGAQTVTEMSSNAVEVRTGNNYLCVRLEGPGAAWVTPWRHIVSMGRNFGGSREVRWGHWPDFNGDGRAELLMTTASAVRVFHFTGAGAVTSGATIPGPMMSASPVALGAVGDVDGDSYGDAVIAWEVSGRREVYLHRGGPMGLGGPGLRVAPSESGSDMDLTLGARVFSLGDRGADGRSNFGLSAVGGTSVRTFGVDETGSLVEGPDYASRAAIESFVSDADADGDGQPDTAFTTGSGTFLSLSSQTNNVQIAVGSGSSTGFGRRLAFVGDLDNDGRSELAVLSPGTREVVIFSWVNNALVTYGRFDLPGDPPVSFATLGEVNRDFADDFALFAAPQRARLVLGGFTRYTDVTLPWREPLGVILAGAADADTGGRAWGGGTTEVAPNGLLIYGSNGSTMTSLMVPDTLAGPVITVAP
ncbi:MAG: VCBS repeat-containing protein [Polyangiales bacterium]